uniref:TonB-dependent receptor n=1 Tax=candidate division WOR-3 bacterium TaxID=2052148 RepID=A0A7C3UQA7_UNCW3
MLTKKTCLLFIIPLIIFAQIYQVDTIFVTASRVTASLEKLPVATAIIPRDLIFLKTFGDFSLLFGKEGIDIRNYSLLKGLTSLSIFGSSAQQVLILIDGLPFYSPMSGICDLGLISVHNIERIEVVKGPASSIYGANALGGVVNLITQSPLTLKPERLSYSARFLSGSYQTSNLSLSSGFNLKERFGFLLALHQDKTKGMRSNEDGFSRGINLATTYTNLLRLDFAHEWKEVGLPGPMPGKDQIPPYGDSTASSLYDRQKDGLSLLKGEISLPITLNLRIRISPFLVNNTTSFHWIDQFSPDSAVYEDTYKIRTAGGSLISSFSGEETPLHLSFGLDYRDDYATIHSYFYDFSSFAYKDTVYQPRGNKFGLFLEGSLLSQPTFSPSIRYDWDKKSGGFCSPGLGITYPLPFGKFRFHTGRGFRAPTFNDLYWPRAGNPDLKPEEGWTNQAGFDTKRFSFTLFSRRTKNLIAWFPDSAGLWRPSNVDRQEIIGIEWRLELPILKRITFSLSGDWKKAVQIRKEMVFSPDSLIVVRRRSAFLPQWKILPSFFFKDPDHLISLEGDFIGDKVNYYPAYDSFPKVYMKEKKLPAYFLLGFRMEQRVWREIFLSFSIENLFNVSYAEVFGNTISDRNYPRPGRSFFFGLRMKNF